jgi:phage baseplate assembly protein W
MAIGVRFPFQETNEGGVFRYTKSSEEAIRTNLISLLTTKRKQRVMNNNLYSPLYDQIFEQWDEIAEDSLDGKLKEVIGKYIPEITVLDIQYTFDETTYVLTVKVIYSINYLQGITSSVEVGVALTENAL